MSRLSSIRDLSKPVTGRELTPSFLLICDEWSPARGGISQFNRSLAIALAATGHRTTCLVESASPSEFQDAAAHGVTLHTAEPTMAGPNLYVPSGPVIAEAPDVVIGHDIVSGAIAQTYARKYLHAALVYIVHTPTAIEVYKRDDAAQRTGDRELLSRRICADADVVAAVGPLLARTAEALVTNGYDDNPVIQVDPGMDVPAALLQRRRRIPASPTILTLGRTGHIEAKGLDIAAHAVAGLAPAHLPRLLIQGGPAGGCDALRTKLVAESGLARDQVDVRPFTVDASQIAYSLWQSSLCVLPSRVEGFGLAALDAITLGTPVLVSARSGLAETLRSHLGTLADPMIVDVTDRLADDAARWRHAMGRVLGNLPEAFDYAHMIRARLRTVMHWETAVGRLVTGVTPAVNAVSEA
jgi:glycosyltransferase involved in cell wall biosynthesis